MTVTLVISTKPIQTTLFAITPGKHRQMISPILPLSNVFCPSGLDYGFTFGKAPKPTYIHCFLGTLIFKMERFIRPIKPHKTVFKLRIMTITHIL